MGNLMAASSSTGALARFANKWPSPIVLPLQGCVRISVALCGSHFCCLCIPFWKWLRDKNRLHYLCLCGSTVYGALYHVMICLSAAYAA